MLCTVHVRWEFALSAWLHAGANRQLDRLRQSSDIHVSLDDEDMREFDVDEHRETLGAGIPQHLGQLQICFIIRPHRMHEMWTIATDNFVTWVSVSLSVTRMSLYDATVTTLL